MIDSLIGWNRNSVWRMTGPVPAAGCRTGAVWPAGTACSPAGRAVAAELSWAAEAEPAKAAAGATKSPKIRRILDITTYKPRLALVERTLNATSFQTFDVRRRPA